MSIRKIPLKQHGYISKDLNARSAETTEQECEEVESYLSRIRAKLRTDRALNDQVSSLFLLFDIESVKTDILLGIHSICLLCPCILQA